ncbi:MAG: disulfide bond formation protein DsbD, partial [Bacteroidales bacterium]
MKKKLFLWLLPVLFCVSAMAQQNPVKWGYTVKPISETEAELVFSATTSGAYHLYSQFMEEGGPMPTIFHFPKSKDFKLIGKASEHPKPT